MHTYYIYIYIYIHIHIYIRKPTKALYWTYFQEADCDQLLSISYLNITSYIILLILIPIEIIFKKWHGLKCCNHGCKKILDTHLPCNTFLQRVLVTLFVGPWVCAIKMMYKTSSSSYIFVKGAHETSRCG